MGEVDKLGFARRDGKGFRRCIEDTVGPIEEVLWCREVVDG